MMKQMIITIAMILFFLQTNLCIQSFQHKVLEPIILCIQSFQHELIEKVLEKVYYVLETTSFLYYQSIWTLVSVCQGFILVYDVTDRTSFDCMDRLKKEIDKSKEKKEVRYAPGQGHYGVKGHVFIYHSM